MAKEFYRINVAGLERDLPLCPISDSLNCVLTKPVAEEEA